MLLLLWGTPLMEILIGALKKPFGALLTQMCFPTAGAAQKGVRSPAPLGSRVTVGLPPSVPRFCVFSPQIEEQLRKAEGKVGKKALKESDYIEVLERSCSQDWER